MPDFTNIDDAHIGGVISALNQGIDNFLKNLNAIKKIHGVTTVSNEVIMDLLALSEGRKTLGEIVSHRRKRVIFKKDKELPSKKTDYLLFELDQQMLLGTLPEPTLAYFEIGGLLEKARIKLLGVGVKKEAERIFSSRYFPLAERILSSRYFPLERPASEPYTQKLEFESTKSIYVPEPMYVCGPYITEGGGING